MPQTRDALHENQIPLVVDLDGTLIKTDLLWESLARLLRRNPFWLFPILFWWTRGRAFLKRKLSAHAKIDPSTLPYHKKFLTFLREQKNAGRKIVLATASDLQMALPVANHVAIFDEVLASDGKTNLRSTNKLKMLVKKFGERGFDYAGNSDADFAVWRGAREAIVVNAGQKVLKQASQCTKLGPTFIENYSPFSTAKSFLNELFIRSGYFIAIIAGLLLAAAFPKIGVAGFAWIAPAFLVFAAHEKNSSDVFRLGYVGGISFWLASLYWLLLMPYRWHSLPLGPVLSWISLCVYLALYPAIWVWLLAGKIGEGNWSRRTLWSLAGAAVWVALEMIRARLLGGFPWNFLGVSQFKMIPLIQIASVMGVYGVSFLIVWFSLSLFSAALVIFRKPVTRFAWQAEIVLPMLAVVALFIFGFAKAGKVNPSTQTLRVILIQPSIPQTLIWDENENSNRFRQLLELSENALTDGTDLLIWPEAAVPELSVENFRAISELAQSHHIWIIFNGDDVEFHPDATNYFNSSFLVNPNGELANIYHKRKLVIFGEYIPLTRWLPFLKWFTPITDGYAPGDKSVTFALDNLNAKTSTIICFEDTFPQLARENATDDLDFLVNLTNDGWFGQSAEQWQHMANAVFRAVENGVPLLRCANNGVTCWIGSNGRVQQIFTDKNESVYGIGTMTVQVPLPSEKLEPTFYNRHGDWFGWSCVAIAVGILLFRLKQFICIIHKRGG